MKKIEKQTMKSESKALFISMYGGVFFVIAECLMALYTSSQSILMDAVYGAADLIMIVISIKIVPLLYRPMTEKHPFGFSQVEAIFITIKGTMLSAVTVGLVLNNIQIMLKGGNEIEFGMVAVFEFTAAMISVVILLAMKRMNKNLGSPIVKMEIDAWTIDLVASIGLAVAFVLPVLVTTPWMVRFSPYLDQVVAILLSAIILPTPVKTVLSRLRDLFLLAPDSETIDKIKEIGDKILSSHGMEEAMYDIIKTGRKIWVSVYFKSPTDIILVTDIVKTHGELETALKKEYQYLYVELIPEFERTLKEQE